MASVFIVDDPTLSALGVDLAWPLMLTSQGDLATVGGLDNLVQSAVLATRTREGELAHKPLEGTNWGEFLNGPDDPVEQATLEARCLLQFKRDARISSAEVDVTSTDRGDTTVNLRLIAKTGATVEASVPTNG